MDHVTQLDVASRTVCGFVAYRVSGRIDAILQWSHVASQVGPINDSAVELPGLGLRYRSSVERPEKDCVSGGGGSGPFARGL